MNIAFITPSVSRSAGGIFEVELALGKALVSSGCNITVYGQRDENTNKDLSKWDPMEVQVFPSTGPHAFRYSPLLKNAVVNSNCELAHLHVIWMYTSIVTNHWHKKGKPYMVTIHGMLEPWALKNAKLKKKIVKLLYEGKCLANATCIHAHTYKEYEDIRSFGLTNSVCVIPNGVEIPQTGQIQEKPGWHSSVKDRKVLLYLGRLHPKKGLENLIEAWALLKAVNKNWLLVIAGWGEKPYMESLKAKTQQLHQQSNIIFPGPQFEGEKNQSFASADAFILPSFSEGLPMAILEAWSYRLPVLSTPACNIPEGYERQAAIEIKASVEGIKTGLQELFSLNAENRKEMGENGYKLVVEKFTWEKIGQQMAEVYRWLLQGGQTPKTIILN